MSDTVIWVNGEERTVPAAGLLGLLQAEGLDPSRPGFAVAINGTVVPRKDWQEQSLAEGDRVEIVGMYKGG